jgi:hypothetical protein
VTSRARKLRDLRKGKLPKGVDPTRARMDAYGTKRLRTNAAVIDESKKKKKGT